MFKPNSLAWLICVAMLPLSGCDQKSVANAMGATPAAAASPVAAPAYTPLSADQLYQLVSPVALFPDKLLAQVLAGAGYPDQVSAADNWLAQNRGLQPAALANAASAQPWDPSVRGLVQFPDVLDQMAKNIPWTSALGDAYLNDPSDVMNAIQMMRQRAAAKGTLKTSPQQRVIVTPATQYVEQQPYPQSVVVAPAQTIVIEPSQPDVVYVPRYDPWVAYGEPVPAYPSYHYQSAPGYSSGDMLATGVISFGVGIVVGALINQNHHDDWHSWDVHWNNRRRPVVYNNAPYISHSTTVINRVTNINQYNNVNRSNTVNNYHNAPVNQPPRFAAPHALTPSPHTQPPMGVPTFKHTAPVAVRQSKPIPASPVHQAENRPMRQPEQRITAPHAIQPVARPPAIKPAVHSAPEAPPFRPQPIRQPDNPPLSPFHQQRVQRAEKRPVPAAKEQEHRPLKIEPRKVE